MTHVVVSMFLATDSASTQRSMMIKALKKVSIVLVTLVSTILLSGKMPNFDVTD